MRSLSAGLRKRLFESDRRLAGLKRRMVAPVGASDLPRIVNEMQSLIDVLEVAVGDVTEAMDEATSWREVSAAAQRRAEILFQISPTPCVSIDLEGLILEINAVAAKLLNVTPRHIVGRAFPTFLAGDRPSFLRLLGGVVQTKATARWDSTIRPRDKGPVAATIVVVLDSPDRILLILQVANPMSAANAVHQSPASRRAVSPVVGPPILIDEVASERADT